jgi:catechol 2,3-dioxygenase-like lactoylglutathione lyase family enzyme
MHPVSPIGNFDHVGITVKDLDTVTAFFAGLGLETEGRTVLESEFLDTLLAYLTPYRDRHAAAARRRNRARTVELHSPRPRTRFADPMPNELGLHNVTFEVDDLQAILGWLAAADYRLVGGVGQYEGIWRMASVRGPEEFIVNLAQRIT